jgi:DNA-binding MarR family transcriptional regulator
MGIALKKDKRKTNATAPFAYVGLDRVIHEHARLSVLTSLITHSQGLAFAELKQLCALTDGNLSRHLQVLEEAGLIGVHKGIEHNRPLTICRVTPAGRRRYIEYLGVLERVIVDAEAAVKKGESPTKGAHKPAPA